MDTAIRLGEEAKRVQGERIRRARIWVALTQRELAAEISWLTDTPISHNIISQVEKGERDVTTREMRAIAYITGQSREWLEGEESGVFDDTVGAATLNCVIPGYDQRLWRFLITPDDSEFDSVLADVG